MVIDPLLGDIYELDLDGRPDIQKLVDAGAPWHGLGLKATEGLYYPNLKKAYGARSAEWFMTHWPQAALLAGARYGVDWFRFAYHYFIVGQDPIAQADFFLTLVDHAGGWGIGDLPPMVDLEDAGQKTTISKQQVIDGMSGFAEAIHKKHGRRPILYGGNFIAERGITDHMGCDLLVTARYTETLPPWTYKRLGWQLDTRPDAKVPSLLGWQLTDGKAVYVKGYPKVSPMGAIDYTAVLIAGGGQNALAWMRAHNWAEAPAPTNFAPASTQPTTAIDPASSAAPSEGADHVVEDLPTARIVTDDTKTDR